MILIAGCSKPAPQPAQRRASQTDLGPEPRPVAQPPDPPAEPAVRKQTDGRPFAATTVDPLGPVALSTDGSRLIAVSNTGRVTMQWSVEGGALISDHDGPMPDGTTDADGLTTIDDHLVGWFWSDAQDRREVVIFKPGEPVKWRLPAMSALASPDATTLAVYTSSHPEPPHGIRLYTWPELVLDRTLPSKDVTAGLAFGSRNRLFQGEDFGRLTMWDTATGARTPLFDSVKPLNATVHRLDVSPDGRRLLVGSTPYMRGTKDPMLELWATDPPRRLEVFDTKSVMFVAFLDDTTFVHHGFAPHVPAQVLGLDPTTSEWTILQTFRDWGPEHVALDRTRRVLYGTSGGNTHVQCLDLSMRGQCPDPG